MIRLTGRLLFAVLLGGMALALAFIVRAGIAHASRDAGMVSDERAYGDAEPSLVYLLRQEPTVFVFSRPQQRVRIVTNAELRPGGTSIGYGFKIEAFDAAGKLAWSRAIHVRTRPLSIRDQSGRLVPHAYIGEEGAMRPSAADVTLVDFDRGVTSVRLSAGKRAPGHGRILARVQEQRPMTQRQIEVGWNRLSKAEQAQLTAGNPLGSELVSNSERRALLVERWNPVGPSGVEGRDYIQTILYERDGPVVATPAEAS